MKELQKTLLTIEERIAYLRRVKNYSNWGDLDRLKQTCDQCKIAVIDQTGEQLSLKVRKLKESLTFLERQAEEHLTPIERVRIARAPQRFSLREILENVYDDYTELGGRGEASVEPAMICAKATITRWEDTTPQVSCVMVIGHDIQQVEESENRGLCKPQGNEKARRYMKVAETEGTPIHLYIFTPGSYPVEEGTGAAQQIARNIYTMTKLKVPMVSMISEGDSEGAEAIGLSDYKIMCSHGYYSVISPERAAAIEGKISQNGNVPEELIEVCAERLRLTAEDNLHNQTIDRIISEPPLGAKSDDLQFFAKIRSEMVRATNKVVLSTKNFNAFRPHERRLKKSTATQKTSQLVIAWDLNTDETARMLTLRSKKYRAMGVNSFKGTAEKEEGSGNLGIQKTEKAAHRLRLGDFKSPQRQVTKIITSVSTESAVILKRLTEPIGALIGFRGRKTAKKPQRLITYTGSQNPDTRKSKQFDPLELTDTFTSPLANQDRTVSCPNFVTYGCKDLWIPDLYGDFAGVCDTCGHHFPLEYQWYMENIFDRGSITQFNTDISAGNPLHYTGFSKRLGQSKIKTGRRAGLMTFHAGVNGIKIIVAMLYSDFHNGTVGTAEGEKFVQACVLAQKKRMPLLAYVHTTGGLRIQEGSLALTQMPKCTMAVREYIESGGLYLVVYDNNSYAGPVASFLGCSPYQFAIRSSRIGFAGRQAIKEATGMDIPPDYHAAENAFQRGHIQGIWDRREFRKDLHKSLLTMGNSAMYYL